MMRRNKAMVIVALFIFAVFVKNAAAGSKWWSTSSKNVGIYSNKIEINMPSTVSGEPIDIATGVNLGSSTDGDVVTFSFTTQSDFKGSIRVYREDPWILFDEIKPKTFAAGDHSYQFNLGNSLASNVVLIFEYNYPENAGNDIELLISSMVVSPYDEASLYIPFFLAPATSGWQQTIYLQNLSTEYVNLDLKFFGSNGESVYDEDLILKPEEKIAFDIDDKEDGAVYGEINFPKGTVSADIECLNKNGGFLDIIAYINLSGETGKKSLLTFVKNSRLINELVYLANPGMADVDVKIYPKNNGAYIPGQEISLTLVGKSSTLENANDLFPNVDFDEFEIESSEKIYCCSLTGGAYYLSMYFLKAKLLK